MKPMFTERKCVLTLEGGHKVVATLTIPTPTKPVFPEEMERRLVAEINKSQPHMKNKCVGIHIMRN